MRPSSRRLKAFTLVELLVTLALSAIVVTMAYAAYWRLSSLRTTFERRVATVSRVNDLHYQLLLDFKRAQAVRFDGQRLRFHQPHGGASYTFTSSAITRLQQELHDSLPVRFVRPLCYFQGQPRDTGLIDELSLQVRIASDTFYLHGVTRYSAAQLLQAIPASPSFP